MSEQQARFDVYVQGGLLEVATQPGSELPAEVASRLPLEEPGFLGLELGRDEMRALSLQLQELGVPNLPVPVAYRRPAITLERARELATPYLQRLQAELPRRKWGPIEPLPWGEDVMTWYLRSTAWATPGQDDDLFVSAYIDKVDGHIVSQREYSRYRRQWLPNADFLLATDDVLSGTEEEQLRAAEFLARGLPERAHRETLQIAGATTPYKSVRTLISRWVELRKQW
jgi:hypothetical protein